MYRFMRTEMCIMTGINYNMNLVYGSCKPNGLKTTLNGVCLIIIIVVVIKSKHSEIFCDVGLWVGHGKGRKIQFVQYKNQYAYRESL